MRPTSVVAESNEQSLPLCSAFSRPAIEVLKLIAHAFKPKALLVNLAVEWAALRGWVTENGEEARTLAADAPRLRHQPVDLELLPIDHVFRAPNLVGAGRVCVALIERCQLRLKPLAGGICRLCVGCRQAA
ncbi:MAG TPA: hypothetical protein VFL53_10650 [Pseudolabrys sp.]|nr:hypothetical protein [Pseudolabrys sp.]